MTEEQFIKFCKILRCKVSEIKGDNTVIEFKIGKDVISMPVVSDEYSDDDISNYYS